MTRNILQSLLTDYTEPVRDPLWKHIYLSPALKKIIQTPEFLRLGGIKQLGPASQVYPGAVHTRFSHSLGAFYLTRQILLSLFKTPGEPILSDQGVKTLLCAALLHDIGHFPHAHALEDFSVLSHETLSGRIITDSTITDLLRKEVGVSPGDVAAVIDHGLPAEGNREIHFARNILSGVLDPDKLDYLNRDAYFCGIPYGVQDTDFVISQIVPHQDGIAVTRKGVTAIENILFSKYLMYRTVYWHRTVRLITALIKKAVFYGLNDGIINAEKLYLMDDISFLKEYSRNDPPYLALIEQSGRPSLYKVVYERDFDETDSGHVKLQNAGERNLLEQRIAEDIRGLGISCSELHTVIDTPRQVSFEVDLPVVTRRGEIPFPEAGSVFTRPVVSGFTRTLHKIRLILPRDTASALQRTGKEDSFYSEYLN